MFNLSFFTLPTRGGTSATKGTAAERPSAETSAASSAEASAAKTATACESATTGYVEGIGHEGCCASDSQPMVFPVLAQEVDAPDGEEEGGQTHRDQCCVIVIVAAATEQG